MTLNRICIIFFGMMLLSCACAHNKPEIPVKTDLIKSEVTDCNIFFKDPILNFEYTIPTKNWYVIDPQRANPHAAFAMQHIKDKKKRFIITYRKLREKDKNLTVDSFSNAIYQELVRLHGRVAVQKEEPSVLDGVKAVNYAVYAQDEAFFKVVSCVANGFIYELIFAGYYNQNNIEKIKTEFVELIDGFSFIQHAL